MQLTRPVSHAQWAGVHPLSVCALRFAPAFINTKTHFLCPLEQAICNGVLPPHSGSGSLGSSPLRMCSSSNSRFPTEAASCSSLILHVQGWIIIRDLTARNLRSVHEMTTTCKYFSIPTGYTLSVLSPQLSIVHISILKHCTVNTTLVHTHTQQWKHHSTMPIQGTLTPTNVSTLMSYMQ